MKQRFLAIVSEVLEEQNVTEDSSASTLGNWDSVGHMNLILALEQEFGLRFQEQEIPELMNCKVLLERIQQAS